MSILQTIRTGTAKLLKALLYSWAGIRTAFQQRAFRQESVVFLVLLLPVFLLPLEIESRLILLIVNSLVLIVEVLNTGLETIVNLVSPEYNKLAGQAKDLGSAAVFLSLLLAAVTWGLILIDFLATQ